MAYQIKYDVQIVEVKKGSSASEVSDRMNQGYEIRGFTADSESHSVLLVKKIVPKDPE